MSLYVSNNLVGVRRMTSFAPCDDSQLWSIVCALEYLRPILGRRRHVVAKRKERKEARFRVHSSAQGEAA
uniref:Protein kinase domain-containing protein n=1 Tax=Panagrellus redivivus TaxID=6233 RepID=A0A7E4VI93_PANRE